jgi:ribosomal protein S18 acetylase RimI-like enzyme
MVKVKEKKKEIVIRKAELKDLPVITKFALKLLLQHYKFDVYNKPNKNMLNNQKKFFKNCILNTKMWMLLVAEDKTKNKIVGYSLAFIHNRPPVYEIRKIGFIADMFVLPLYGHQGVGNLFLKELFKGFKKKKIKYIELTVHIKNDIAKAAWKKYGFKEYMSKQVLRL